MYNNLFTRDPFGVFNETAPTDGKTKLFTPSHPKERKAESSTSWWAIVGVFLLITCFGFIFYFKEALVKNFKKMVSNVNDKVNPELKKEPTEEEEKTKLKLLTESVEPKIERTFLIKDKASWDIPYINQKQQERKAIFAEELGWTIYE
ncbi:MAG: hypothetical protein MUF58_00025 [Arcicella sp.]|jgi:Sec-independent protein translocase protein TatA|nr:hypothetical protein [Arcicella sp.]